MWGAFPDPRFPQLQADAIEKAARAGAKGLKVLKTLGLYLRERGREGPLVKVDDRRFDPMWEACAAHRLPVYIHVSDPEAFFLPIDCTNERWDELGHHPDWSFHGKDFPSHAGAHGGAGPRLRAPPEDALRGPARGPRRREPAVRVRVARPLPEPHRRARRPRRRARPPAARLAEVLRDATRTGSSSAPTPCRRRRERATPQQVFKDELYEIYYRFLETEDEYFDYAPAPVPPQGRWRIYGIALPDGILKKVYHENAERLLGLAA